MDLTLGKFFSLIIGLSSSEKFVKSKFVTQLLAKNAKIPRIGQNRQFFDFRFELEMFLKAIRKNVISPVSLKSTEIAQMSPILKSLNPVWLSLITKIDKIEVCKNKSARATRAATASLPIGLQQKKTEPKNAIFSEYRVLRS